MHFVLSGLKYALAVRSSQDIVCQLASVVVPVLTEGLKDQVDDVKAVVAESLKPVVAAVAASVQRGAQSQRIATEGLSTMSADPPLVKAESVDSDFEVKKPVSAIASLKLENGDGAPSHDTGSGSEGSSSSLVFQAAHQFLSSPAFQSLFGTLWDSLLELDDISSSTNSVMAVLADVHAIPHVHRYLKLRGNGGTTVSANSGQPWHVVAQEEEEDGASAMALASMISYVPRLYPFLRHTIHSVRRMAIQTIYRLITSSMTPTGIDDVKNRPIHDTKQVKPEADVSMTVKLEHTAVRPLEGPVVIGEDHQPTGAALSLSPAALYAW